MVARLHSFPPVGVEFLQSEAGEGNATVNGVELEFTS